MHQSWMGEGSFDHGLHGDASIMDWEGSFDHGLGGDASIMDGRGVI